MRLEAKLYRRSVARLRGLGDLVGNLLITAVRSQQPHQQALLPDAPVAIGRDPQHPRPWARRTERLPRSRPRQLTPSGLPPLMLTPAWNQHIAPALSPASTTPDYHAVRIAASTRRPRPPGVRVDRASPCAKRCVLLSLCGNETQHFAPSTGQSLTATAPPGSPTYPSSRLKPIRSASRRRCGCTSSTARPAPRW